MSSMDDNEIRLKAKESLRWIKKINGPRCSWGCFGSPIYSCISEDLVCQLCRLLAQREQVKDK